VFIFIFFNKCSYHYIEYPETIQDEVSYSKHIQVIFDNHCIYCHNQNTNIIDLSAGNSYKELLNNGFFNVVDPQKSKLLMKINEPHPQQGIPANDEIQQIKKWMKNGAVNN
jgi:acetone carboxylase gamma subunit